MHHDHDWMIFSPGGLMIQPLRSVTHLFRAANFSADAQDRGRLREITSVGMVGGYGFEPQTLSV